MGDVKSDAPSASSKPLREPDGFGHTAPADRHERPSLSPNRLLERVVPTRPQRRVELSKLERSARRRVFVGSIGVPMMGVAIVLVFAAIAPNFLTGGNINDILDQAALPMIVAVGLTVCLAMGEFDLSLNGVAGIATVLIAVLVLWDKVGTLPAIAIVLAAGSLVGAVNGVLVGYFRVTALIVTIAVNSILEGWEFVFSHGTQVFGTFPAGLNTLGNGQVLGVPYVVLLAAAVVITVWILMERSVLGRNLRAVGGNPEAARIAGVNTARTRLAGFVICSTLAALAGLLFGAQQGTALPLSGLDLLLPSFAACFIGAAMFTIVRQISNSGAYRSDAGVRDLRYHHYAGCDRVFRTVKRDDFVIDEELAVGGPFSPCQNSRQG